MSELQKIKRAKIYMDQFSRGINPISNQPVGKEMKNERLVKCFIYVSELLDKIIQSGEDTDKLFYKKTYSQIDYFDTALSKQPVAVKEFAKKIVEAGGLPITPANITNWLVSENYLNDSVGQDGKKIRTVTEKGKKLGINTQTKTNFNGEAYQMNFYDKQAQKFILSHLNEIIFFKTINKAKKTK